MLGSSSANAFIYNTPKQAKEPPYLEHATGKGGWVEEDLLSDWKPPPHWGGVSAHTKNLSNLYVYFWRWAAWKVFENSRHENGNQTDHENGNQTDHEIGPHTGIVSFILNPPIGLW